MSVHTFLNQIIQFLLYSMQIFQTKGFHRKWSLIIIACLWILGTFNTLVLLPKFKVGHQTEKRKVAAKNQNGDIKMVSITHFNSMGKNIAPQKFEGPARKNAPTVQETDL